MVCPAIGVVEEYRIYAGQDPGSETFLQSVPLGSLTSTHSGLPNLVRRYYRVSAANAFGESPLSNEVFEWTPGAPSAPRNLQASPALSPGDVTLTWTIPQFTGGTAITEYRVYRDAFSCPWCNKPEVAVLGASATSFTDTTCPAGVLCWYVVKAGNGVGLSLSSDEVFFPGWKIRI